MLEHVDKQTQFNENYLKLVQAYLEEMEKLLETAQDQILHELDIDKYEIFQESILTLMEKGMDKEMCLLQAGVRQKLK